MRFPKHGPKRRWRHPWKVTCRCGLDDHPCAVVRLQAQQCGITDADLIRGAVDRYGGGLAEVRRWQHEQRRRWAAAHRGGAS